MTSSTPSRWLQLALAAVLIVVLAACSSGDDDEDPTPTATTTTSQPTASPALAPGQRSLGELLDTMNGATGTVTSARSVFFTRNTNGTPTAGSTIVEEYVAPNERRIQTLSGTTVLDDQIAIGNAVYMRGSFVTAAVAPMLSPEVWITVDPALVPPDSPVGNVVTYLVSPFHLPFATVSDDLRARTASPAGQIDVAGRTCDVWTFVDTTDFGDQIDYALAVDARGLPCNLVERAGTVENVTTFEFNVPGLDIIAPDAATPVSGTPEG